MIIVKLWGGLCNQMFQYAFGYSLSKKYCDELFFDSEYFNEQRNGVGKRNVVVDKYFNLSNFSIIERPKEFNLCENRYINRIIRSTSSGRHICCGNRSFFYKEPYRIYQEVIPYYEGMINYYDGYWLSSRYFNMYRDEILNEFSLSEENETIVKDKMFNSFNEESVSIHIRRGDYLSKSKNNAPVGLDEKHLNLFYKNAIDYILQSVYNPVFYVFSDDIEWCENNFKNQESKISYIQNSGDRADLLDLMCMSKCKHGIMSPSTFSWWGNWLKKDNENSVILLPKGNYANNYFSEPLWKKI